MQETIQNRKYIIIVDFLKQFISVFFSLFFNIYILKIVNNDMMFIVKYSVYDVIIQFILVYLVLKWVNQKNAKYLYRASFPLLAFCTILLLVFKEKIVLHIYLFRTIYDIATIFYSTPFELMTIDQNTQASMSNFVANTMIAKNVGTILAPIFSGFIISAFSYQMLFVLLTIEAVIIVVVSFKIGNIKIENNQLEVKKFWNIVKNKPFMQEIYHCMFFRRISAQGAVNVLLPIVLFMKLQTELDLGAYNSVFAIISIISLAFLRRFNCNNRQKKFYILFACVIFVSSLLVIWKPSLAILVLFYVLMNSLGSVLESESCFAIYAALPKELRHYKKEHILVFNIYMTIAQLISYAVIWMGYQYFYNVNILSILMAGLMFFLIIAAMYLQKTVQYIQKKI